MIYDITLKVVDGQTSTTYAGAAVSIETVKVVGQVASENGAGISDGDKGDITVSAGGTVWTVDGRSITAEKLFEVGGSKLLGRHTGTAGDVQEVSVDGGLEFHGGQLRRAALTGAVTAAAGSGTTVLAQSGAIAGQFYKWDGTSWVPATISFLEDIGDIPSTFPPEAHTHTLSNLTQSGATTGQVAQWNGAAWVPATPSAISGFTLDTAVYATQTFARVLVNDAATNVNVVFRPKGNGYFSLLMPDGTATGGNQRGQFAVDLNTRLTAANFVASGAGSFGAGQNGQASGAGAFCFSGVGGGAVASGLTALAFGGVASGVSAIVLGIGSISNATGDYSVALGGYDCRASGYDALAHGFYALANKRGQRAHATGFFSVQGDAQMSELLARIRTTDATPANMFLDGVSARLTIGANTVWHAEVSFVATTSAAGSYATFKRTFLIARAATAASTTVVGVQTVGTDRGSNAGAPPTGWDVTITADTTNGAANLIVTGAAATTINWFARIDLTEVTRS